VWEGGREGEKGVCRVLCPVKPKKGRKRRRKEIVQTNKQRFYYDTVPF
jgi:hypothetical protein